MKITFLIHSLQLAGAEKVVYDLIRHFHSRQIDCSLIAIYQSSDLQGRVMILSELQASGVPVYELFKSKGSGRFRILRQLNQLLEVLKPDILHAHSFIPNVYAGIRNRMFRKIYTVSTLHSGGDEWSNRKNYWLEKLSIEGIDCVASVSEQLAAFYQHKFKGVEGKLVVVQSGIDTSGLRTIDESQRNVLKQELKLDPDALILIQVARVVPSKNQDFLIRVANCLKKRAVKFTLLLVGNMEDESYLTGIRSEIDIRGLQDEVLLLGSRGDVGQLLQMSDVFLFPTQFESFGMALAEALYCGLPALCSDIPTNHMLAGDNPNNDILPWDEQLWADKLAQKRTRLKPDMKAASLPISLDKRFYSFDQVADDYLLKCYSPSRRTVNNAKDEYL